MEHQHGDLYDHMDNDDARQQVDLDDLPLLDDDGFEITVYDVGGYRVPRRLPTHFNKCGALLNLERVHELFEEQDDQGDDMPTDPTFFIYPIAYTRNLGNIKSPSIIVPFQHMLREIDLNLRPDIMDENMDVDKVDDDVPHRYGAPVLHGQGCQIYNTISHRVRTEPRFHFIQLGMVTTTLAGSSTKSTARERHWTRRVEFCDQALPHKHFAEKVSGDHQPQDLRFENTYTLDVFQMNPDQRDGS